MRKSLLLYLFCFAALIAVFQYVSSRKMLNSKNEEIETLEEELLEAKQKNDSLATTAASPDLFKFESNDAAITYFEERGFELKDILFLVEDEIMGRNKASADNDLVPYEGMEGTMRINRIRILNHQWILADFTDGSYWGELFITYNIDEKGDLELETEKAVIYPKS